MPKRENRRVKDVAVDSADDSDSVNEEELIAAGVIKPTSKGQYHKVCEHAQDKARANTHCMRNMCAHSISVAPLVVLFGFGAWRTCW